MLAEATQLISSVRAVSKLVSEATVTCQLVDLKRAETAAAKPESPTPAE